MIPPTTTMMTSLSPPLSSSPPPGLPQDAPPSLYPYAQAPLRCWRARARWILAWSRAPLDADVICRIFSLKVVEGSFACAPSVMDGSSFFDAGENRGGREIRRVVEEEEGPLYFVLLRGDTPKYPPTWRDIMRQCRLHEMPQPEPANPSETLYQLVRKAHLCNRRFVAELDANYFKCGNVMAGGGATAADSSGSGKNSKAGPRQRIGIGSHLQRAADNVVEAPSSLPSSFAPTPTNHSTTSGASSPRSMTSGTRPSSSSSAFSPLQQRSSPFSLLMADARSLSSSCGIRAMGIRPPPQDDSVRDTSSKVYTFFAQEALNKEELPSMEDILGIIRGLIPMWVQTSASFAPLLNSANPDGVAAFLPGSAQASGTLEMHRLALSREQLILRHCNQIRVHCDDVGYSILDSSYNEGVDFAQLCAPPLGVDGLVLLGEGGVWGAVPASGGGRLGDAMRGLRAMRGESMLRRYVVEDFLTWGMPIITRLFLLGASGIRSAAQVSECITRLNGMRRSAIVQDRQPLEVYLERLGEVQQYLEAVALMLTTGGDPASLQLGPASFFPVGVAMSPTSQEKERLEAVYISARNISETRRIVDNRLRQQRGELTDVLRALHVKRSNVVIMQDSIHASICHAMETDTFMLNKTRHLFPTEHLNDAVYAPAHFLSGDDAGNKRNEVPQPHAPILQGVPNRKRVRATVKASKGDDAHGADKKNCPPPVSHKKKAGGGPVATINSKLAAAFQAAMDNTTKRTRVYRMAAPTVAAAGEGAIDPAAAFHLATSVCSGVTDAVAAEEEVAEEEDEDATREGSSFIASILNNDDDDI